MEFEKIRDIVAGVLGVDKDTITLESKFIDDLGADSLDLFQIILEIENEFEIMIDDSQVENIVTVGDAVREIQKATNE